MGDVGVKKITEEMWVDWQNHPVTKAFAEYLVAQREALKEALALGHFSTEREIYKAIGSCAAISSISTVSNNSLDEFME